MKIFDIKGKTPDGKDLERRLAAVDERNATNMAEGLGLTDIEVTEHKASDPAPGDNAGQASDPAPGDNAGQASDPAPAPAAKPKAPAKKKTPAKPKA